MPAPRVYRTEAVVLRQRGLGDADKICVLFTPQRGRIEAVAKGVRKPASRLAGHVESLTRSTLQLAVGRTLDVITGAQTQDAYSALHDDIDRLSRGLYAAELVDRFTDAASEVGDLYRLFVQTLQRIETAEDVDSAVRWFEMRLLTDQGYRPQLGQCVRCGGTVAPEGNRFSGQAGGVLCPRCAADTPGRPLSASAFKLLRLLQSAPYAEMVRVRIDAALGHELEAHLRDAIQVALDRDVKAAGFIESLRAARRSAGDGG